MDRALSPQYGPNAQDTFIRELLNVCEKYLLNGKTTVRCHVLTVLDVSPCNVDVNTWLTIKKYVKLLDLLFSVVNLDITNARVLLKDLIKLKDLHVNFVIEAFVKCYYRDKSIYFYEDIEDDGDCRDKIKKFREMFNRDRLNFSLFVEGSLSISTQVGDDYIAYKIYDAVCDLERLYVLLKHLKTPESTIYNFQLERYIHRDCRFMSINSHLESVRRHIRESDCYAFAKFDYDRPDDDGGVTTHR